MLKKKRKQGWSGNVNRRSPQFGISCAVSLLGQGSNELTLQFAPLQINAEIQILKKLEAKKYHTVKMIDQTQNTSHKNYNYYTEGFYANSNITQMFYTYTTFKMIYHANIYQICCVRHTILNCTTNCDVKIKHCKNCKSCPVSLLIVRSQRVSWIQVINC